MCQPIGQLLCEIRNMPLSGDKELDDQIRKWVRWDKCPSTVCQIMDAVRAKDWDTLRKRLCNRIKFGTAGLRATMRAGFDSMNELVVIQTAQGLCEYIKTQYPNQEDWSERGVVFGFDGRYNSHRFAELSAIVFLNNDFKVYQFKRYVPTPFVPYAIIRLQCLAGVMVTASHNPKEDNGYKVYWTNGAQIIPPHDEGIEESILNNLDPRGASTDDSAMCSNSMLEDPYDMILQPYFDVLKKGMNCTLFECNEKCSLTFTYTAMHGVGYEFAKAAFARVNLKPFVSVAEQQDPDPEFPTTPNPNPEEPKALELAMKTAKSKCSEIILANDPDADRLAVAERDDDGNYKAFTGNEVGAMLGWWALELYKIQNPNADLSNVVMISSTVSSKILKAMADREGFEFIETPTGFKWMGNKALELQAAGKTVLFAFEEAIGYMFGTAVPDKDGITAAAQFASFACYLRCKQCMSLQEKMRDIYETYGYQATISSYVICRCPPVIEKIFERLRTWDEGKADTYPTSVKNGEYEIVGVRDLTTGYDSSTSDKKSVIPPSAGSQMITFTFKNGAVVTLRTSGTEPKMKYYADMSGRPEEKNWTRLTNNLKILVDAVVEEFYEPTKNGLQRRKE
ncbi:hypothetical protein KR038_012035 [Drosophila bunnanda]|nr:hypothetical protein KR038_012035 [Drosophila bunnanda]